MTAGWICVACGNHYPAADTPPACCLICTDERQWVPQDGQRWTTLAELATDGRRCDIGEVEPGLLGLAGRRIPAYALPAWGRGMAEFP